MIGGIGSIFSALWLGSRYRALREIVSPIYDQLGIAPAVARGLQDAAKLNTPPIKSG